MKHKSLLQKSKPTVIDLFCGCGGLSQGFIDAGFDVLLGVDHWKDAIDTFKHNHDNVLGLVADLNERDVRSIANETGIQKIDVIIGGPPCQGYSIAGKRIIEDERNQLYKSFVKFVKYFNPKIFLMENVPNILTMGDGYLKKKILKDFQNIGYSITTEKLLASNYGVPQNRKRAFFIGTKKGYNLNLSIPETNNIVTTKDAISDLPENSLLDGSTYPQKAESKYQKYLRHGSRKVHNHIITEHKDKTIEIISLVPDGGNYKSLPEHLRDTRKVNIAWTRLNSEKPGFTIDTGHRHHFHYKFNRIPTVRESARIQSFSDKFIFLGSKTSQYKQVGNAVPPMLAQKIALFIKEELNKYV